jgi:type III pantothenate kinase
MGGVPWGIPRGFRLQGAKRDIRKTDMAKSKANSKTNTKADTSNKALLTIDVGNSYTRLGSFNDESLVDAITLTTPAHITPDEARLSIYNFMNVLALHAPITFSDSIIASVVPSQSEQWAQAAKSVCNRTPLVVGPGIKSGIKLDYNNPSEIGADRIADMVAARQRYGSPLIAVDLGTTTNMEIIDDTGAFVGGIIAPGMAVSADAISSAAAKLASTEIRAPKTIIGKNTRDAMRSGIVLGELARMDGLIGMIWNELGYETAIVISGLYANEVAALSKYDITPDDGLTLRGLALLYKLNRK